MKTTDKAEKAREMSLRRKISKYSMDIVKSRKNTSVDNLGGYMIVDTKSNGVIKGSRFDMTLDDIEDYLSELN